MSIDAAAASDAGVPTRERLDRVVAVVDQDIITEQELIALARVPLSELTQGHGPAERAAMRHRVLQQALEAEIGERLLGREVKANKDKLGVADKDIDRAVEEVMRINHVDRDGLQAALYGQGLTWGDYRDKLRQQLERTRLVQLKVQGKVQVKHSEAKRRCMERQRLGGAQSAQMICASHILLRLAADPSAGEVAQQMRRAQALREELLAGKPIAELAAEHSDDPSAKDGALGCFGRGEMVESFEAAAFALEVGQPSEVVRTPFGLHLIVVTEHRQNAVQDCGTPSALEPFKAELYQEEMGRQMELWLGELREQAFVEMRL